MEKIKSATYFCAMLFFGLIIGGAIKGNTSAWVSGLVLLIVDIGIGISIQYFINKSHQKTTWSELSENEKKLFQQEPSKKIHDELQRKGVNVEKVIKNSFNKIEQRKDLDCYDAKFDIEENCNQQKQSNTKNVNIAEKSGKGATDDKDFVLTEEDIRVIKDVFKNCKSENLMQSKFNDIYEDLEDEGGARLVSEIDYEEDATAFLVDMCLIMSHAPHISTLSTLAGIFADHVGELHALVYGFRYSPNSMCQNAYIFLVNTKDSIRFFAIETDIFCGFCLCEYADGIHKNYGAVELAKIPTRINEIINK